MATYEPPEQPQAIEPEFVMFMNDTLRILDDAFNGKGCPVEDKKIGFFLAVFKNSARSRLNYISNVDKFDVAEMLRGILRRLEYRISNEGCRLPDIDTSTNEAAD